MESVPALAGGPALQFMIHLVSDTSCLIDRLFHGKNEARDGLVGQVIETDFFQRNRTDPIPTSGFTQVGVTLPGVDQNDGNLRGVAVSLPDHFGGGAELFRGAGDRGGRAQSAEFEFEHGRRFASGKGDGIQLPETVPTPKLISMFRVLVTENASFSQMKVTGEDGADSELCGEADDGEGRRLDPDLALPLALAATAKGKALRPAEVFGIIVGNEIDLAVIGGRMGVGVGIQRGEFPGFFAPTTQQTPALQRAKARVPDQNHSPLPENL